MPQLDFRPLAFYISYPKLLDNCVVKFIDDFNSDFGYDEESGSWILMKRLSKKKLEDIFSEYLALELQRLLLSVERKWPNVLNKIYFICDDGFSSRNYYLSERDIALDLETLESVWSKIFAKWFATGHDHNVVFCKHSEMRDFDWIHYILQKHFGTRRVVDLSQEIKSGMKSILEKEIPLSSEISKETKKECLQWIEEQIRENSKLEKLK